MVFWGVNILRVGVKEIDILRTHQLLKQRSNQNVKLSFVVGVRDSFFVANHSTLLLISDHCIENVIELWILQENK